MSNIKTKITSLVSEVTNHWNEAPKGRYMPYKEIVSYAGGGIGVKFLAVMATNMILSATNVLIGNTLGVEPIDVYILYFISVIVNIPLSGIRANIIDNTRSKEGKYRPYIVKMGIPSAIVTILFVWFPYNDFGALFGEGTFLGKSRAYVVTCAVILILNFFQNFFYYFFSEAYDNLIHVLSPNTQERADVTTVKGVVYSLAPSVLNLAMPIFAQLFTNDNLYDIRLYRYIYPPLAIFSVALSIVVYVNTKEKIVQAKTHVIQIKFIDSLREVLKNKYFWVIALATWLGFLETSMTVILGWLYSYGGICNGTVYSVITLICQNAGLVGMLIAPFAIRKWGKRVVLIGTNVLNIVFIAMMFPVVRVIDMTGESTSALHTWMPLILLVICYWMNNLMNAFMQILTPSINADIRDYQQYITGERIDGMFSTITAVGGLITVASSGIVNLLYDKFGINTETAQTVLNDPDVMNKVLRNGKIVRLSREDCRFAYRQSAVGGGDFVLGAMFRLSFSSQAEILSRMRALQYKRNQSQPKGRSAGSVYLKGEKPAGWYIEQSGLKGAREGGAVVSEKHANFILNTGGATAKDVLTLMERLEAEVYKNFGVRLKREIRLIGDF